MFNLDFLHRSSLMGTTLLAAPSKSYAFSTNYHACIALPRSRRCVLPILFWPWPPYNLLPRSCLTWIFFVDPHWWVPLCVQRPAKSHAFSTNYHTCIAMPTWPRCAPPILCWPWPPYNLLPRSCLTWIFFMDPHWWVPLCVQHPAKGMPSKAMPFQRTIIQCIAMPTWHRCVPHILFWHWPPFNLFPSSCITWNFFVDSHWWVPLRVQYPTIYVPFRQIIMYIVRWGWRRGGGVRVRWGWGVRGGVRVRWG